MPTRLRQLDELSGSVQFGGGGQFAPTLVIGLGGSGTNTARRLKRLVDRRYGHLGIMRYLFVDTDQAAYAPQPNLADTEPAEQATVIALNATQIRQEMEQGLWPAIGSFLSDDVDVGILRNAEGAGGIRPVGRFALFSQFQNFYEGRLRPATSDVLNVGQLVNTVLRGAENRVQIATGQPRVYIVSSICGGTGSSLFLDVALLTRYAFRRSQVEPAIVGLFFLPSVFRNERGITPTFRETILANGYAALMELEHFCDPAIGQAGMKFEYPGLGAVEIDGPLFDECHLLEGTNAAGQQLATKEEVFEMAARCLGVDIGSPVGARARSAQRNTDVAVRTNPCAETGKVRLMNSLAVTGLAVPVEAIARHGSLHAARVVIHDHLLGSPPKLAALESELNAFLRANHLEERGDQDLLVERLLRDPDGDPLAFRLGRGRAELEAEAEAQGRRGTRGAAQHVAGWVGRRLESLRTDGLAEARRAVQSNRPVVLREATAAIQAQLAQLVREDGLAHAQAYLEELNTVFGVVVEELTAEAREHEEGRRAIEEDINQRRESLNRFGSLMDRLLRGREVETVMDGLLELTQRYGNAEYRHVARSAALDLLNSQQATDGLRALLPQVSEWLQVVRDARAALEAADRLIGGELDRRRPGGRTGSTYVLEQALVDPSQYETYCKNADLDHAALARQLWERVGATGEETVTGLRAVAEFQRRPEELADLVGALGAAELMRHLEQSASVMQVIRQQKQSGETEAEYMRRTMKLMFDICQPFWTTRAPRGIPDYERFMAVTIPCRANDPQLPEIRQAVEEQVRQAGYTPELVETDYPFALEIAARAYGARAYYLGSAEEMRVHYEAKTALRVVRELLHVDKSFVDLLPKIHPESQERAQFLFAWGLVYGYLAKRGERFYVSAEQRRVSGQPLLVTKYETDWVAAIQDRLPEELRGQPQPQGDSGDLLGQGRTQAQQQFLSSPQHVELLGRALEQCEVRLGTGRMVDDLTAYLERLDEAIRQTSTERLREQFREERALLENYLQRLQGFA